ncbi:hypothetical protein RD792_010888 [Penstemon davidsonii]|uniref:t-SNARE coiled-coil homology domain-containing protein n=1 Tax=Penstemon davidsonii TaxID=160366 RepID=A0ABR0D321_9LAMI|nr:hypothetical protein RD792_010888 [Penstemon davidsonii]
MGRNHVEDKVNTYVLRFIVIFGRRDRNARVALFDGIEEGGIRASASYSSHEIDEQENDRAVDGLQDRVNLLKRLSGDIHEEVESHNHMLDRMGNDMDSSRGVLSGTMDKFKMVYFILTSTMLTVHLAYVWLLDFSGKTLKENVFLNFEVFETKSSRRMFTLVASFVVLFLILYYLTK